MMQEGYELIQEEKYIEENELWLDVWGHLRKRFTSDMKSISEAEVVFRGMMQSLFNWCQSLDLVYHSCFPLENSFLLCFLRRLRFRMWASP